MCRVFSEATRRRCSLLQSVTLILYCETHFVASEECRNKPDVISFFFFKQNTAGVRCAHAGYDVAFGSSLQRLVSRHLQTASHTVLLFSYRRNLNSNVLLKD